MPDAVIVNLAVRIGCIKTTGPGIAYGITLADRKGVRRNGTLDSIQTTEEAMSRRSTRSKKGLFESTVLNITAFAGILGLSQTSVRDMIWSAIERPATPYTNTYPNTHSYPNTAPYPNSNSYQSRNWTSPQTQKPDSRFQSVHDFSPFPIVPDSIAIDNRNGFVYRGIR